MRRGRVRLFARPDSPWLRGGSWQLPVEQENKVRNMVRSIGLALVFGVVLLVVIFAAIGAVALLEQLFSKLPN